MRELINLTITYLNSFLSAYKAEAVFFFCSLVFLWLIRKKCPSNIKTILQIVFLLLFVIFNPVVIYMGQKYFLQGTYWRVFWLLPFCIVIPYGILQGVRYVEQKKVEKWLYTGLIIVFVMISGQNLLAQYKLADNPYKLSEETIEVADILLSCENVSMVVVSEDLLADMRQYSSKIRLLYGRNIDGSFMGGDWMYDHIFIYESMNADQPDYQMVKGYTQKNNCNYIVYDKRVEDDLEVMESMGYHLVAQTKEHYIFNFV